MDTLFIEFRDPLFGIILFFALIFIVSFVSYWATRIRTKEDSEQISRFLNSLSSSPSYQELKQEIEHSCISDKLWLQIAQSYSSNGETQMAIQIYQALCDSSKSTEQKSHLLILLARTYFKAGFLQRCEKTLLEMLARRPRTVEALKLLLLTYEKMKLYDKALEITVVLNELELYIQDEILHLNTLKLLEDLTLSAEQKCTYIVKQNLHSRRALEYLFVNNAHLAWSHFNVQDAKKITDILWSLNKESLNLDIISSDEYLSGLYSAKGYVDFVKSTLVFELDVLIKLRTHDIEMASLQFEYRCTNCAHMSLFAQARCSKCNKIDSTIVDISLTQGRHETSNTF